MNNLKCSRCQWGTSNDDDCPEDAYGKRQTGCPKETTCSIRMAFGLVADCECMATRDCPRWQHINLPNFPRIPAIGCKLWHKCTKYHTKQAYPIPRAHPRASTARPLKMSRKRLLSLRSILRHLPVLLCSENLRSSLAGDGVACNEARHSHVLRSA